MTEKTNHVLIGDHNESFYNDEVSLSANLNFYKLWGWTLSFFSRFRSL